jgi:hypothetical protein
VDNSTPRLDERTRVDRAYSRAPITGVTLGWWRKDAEEYRATHQERQRSKLGRMARLRGTVEGVGTLPALSVGELPGVSQTTPPDGRD